MELAALLVKILGIYVFVSGLFLIFRGKTMPMVLKDFYEHPATMWLAGLILIVLGGVMVYGQGVRPTWVIVLGLAILLKGIIYILAPEMFRRFTAPRFRSFLAVMGVLALVVGYLLFTV